MKICFWGNIAGALSGKTDGGGELQIAFIAKTLRKSGHEVIVADWNTTADYITPDGIKIFRIRGWNKGVRVLRTLTHRLPGLYSTLKEINADIYYCRIRDFRHIVAYRVARDLKAKFVLHMASDLDTMSFGKRLRNYYFTKSAGLWWFFSGILVEMVYPWLLRNADLVLVQHVGQKNILLRKKVNSVVFFNLIDVSQIPDQPAQIHKDFTFVGWLDKRKGFPEFYELVERAPGHTFKVIGPPRDKAGQYYFEKLKSYPNVSLLGGLNHSDTLKEIASSKALVSTSQMEGFPNVFIEAWTCGIPVISLNVDPGSVLEFEGLGVNAHGDLDTIVRALDNHCYSDSFARKAKMYVQHNHALSNGKIREINDLFNGLVKKVVAAK